MLTTRISLIQRVRDPADEKSWDEFVRLYRPLLTAYVRKQGFRDDDGDDVVQDILIQLVRTLPKFELDHTRGRFRTFLWRVTNHGVIDAIRKRKRRGGRECQFDEQLLTLEKAVLEEPDVAWIADERRRVFSFVQKEVRASAQPKTWACFEQHLIKGRPAADVAAELGISANVVYVNASRILAKVREKCADYDEELANA
jgi:RNA polymerase sigma-70 factor (ECF subfamily)